MPCASIVRVNVANDDLPILQHCPFFAVNRRGPWSLRC